MILCDIVCIVSLPTHTALLLYCYLLILLCVYCDYLFDIADDDRDNYCVVMTVIYLFIHC